MKTLFVLFISCILSCIPCRMFADEIPYIQYLPEYMPQAPTAQAIARAIDIPVNPYTGIPNINIPIYTIQVGDISVPISLSYQGGGIRPSQEATCVGLGWMLNAGGAITRTVKCTDDFMEYRITNGQYYYGFLDISDWPDDTSVDPDYYITRSGKDDYGIFEWESCLLTDTEPDLYFYSIPDNNGKFSFKKDKSIVQFNRNNNVKIVSPLASASKPYFQVTDSRGTKYYFEVKERTRVYAGTGKADVNTTPDGVDFAVSNDRLEKVSDYTSTWYLTEMISTTYDTIKFEYENEYYYLPLQEKCRKQTALEGISGSGYSDGVIYNISKMEILGKRLARIKWRGLNTEKKETIFLESVL